MSFHIYLMKMIKLVWYNVNYGGGTRLPIKSIERKVLLYNNIDTLQLIVAYPITMLAEIDGIGMKSINDLIRFVQLYCEITEFGDKYTDSKILKEYKDFRKKFSISY